MDIATKYYSVLCAANGIKMSYTEVLLLAFVANKGYINDLESRQEFSKKYNTAMNTVGQLCSRLRRRGFLVKKEGQLKVAQVLDIDFTKDIFITIKLFNDVKA